MVYVMIAVPAETPHMAHREAGVAAPYGCTVAIEILLLLHTPPAILSDSVILAPAQTYDEPVMTPAGGSGGTLKYRTDPLVPRQSNAIGTLLPH